jgi:hypothetical protein
LTMAAITGAVAGAVRALADWAILLLAHNA